MAAGPRRYENKLPELYEEDLAAAERAGVVGVPCPGDGFDRLAAEGQRLVFVVTVHRELIVAPQLARGIEIRHPVLAAGQPVLAAGELEVAHAVGTTLIIELTNKSGHYEPDADCLKLAVEILEGLGYTVPAEVIQPYSGA